MKLSLSYLDTFLYSGLNSVNRFFEKINCLVSITVIKLLSEDVNVAVSWINKL